MVENHVLKGDVNELLCSKASLLMILAIEFRIPQIEIT
jgi:hypothetical protein